MAINSVTGTTSTPGTVSGKDAGALAGEFDKFLLMLTTQLQNQDPTAPMDTNAFTQQLVAFSSVEQSIKTNGHLEKLLEATEGSKIDKATGYVDKIVQAEGNAMAVVGGQGTASYYMPETATKSTINVSNVAGKVVYTTTGEKATGNHDFNWDGKDSTGEQVKDGTYKISVVAEDATGKAIEATTYTVGRVKSISTSGDSTKLNLGGDVVVDLEDIKGLKSGTENSLDIANGSNLDKIAGTAKGVQISNAVSFIGKTIEAEGSDIEYSGQDLDFNYYIGADASKVTIEILDAKGKTISSQQGDLAKGKHSFAWNGQTNAGGTAANGNYTVKITALDGSNQPIDTATTVNGQVTEVDVIGDKTILYLGTRPVLLDSVKSVKAA